MSLLEVRKHEETRNFLLHWDKVVNFRECRRSILQSVRFADVEEVKRETKCLQR